MLAISYFKDDIKQNLTTFFYDVAGRKKWKEINFIDNVKEGKAYEYSLDQRLITIIHYKKGTLMGKEFINRYDKLNKKRDTWKTFYDNGKLKEEMRYKNDLLNGYYKEYDIKGRLINATLYINGIPQNFTAELATLDIRKEYFPNGVVKKEGIYDVTGRENGLFKYFVVCCSIFLYRLLSCIPVIYLHRINCKDIADLPMFSFLSVFVRVTIKFIWFL